MEKEVKRTDDSPANLHVTYTPRCACDATNDEQVWGNVNL